MKNAITSAASFSLDHAKVISKTALFLMEAVQKVEEELAISPGSSVHSTPSAAGDIEAMWKTIVSSQITTEIEGRGSHATMADPREKGLEKIEEGWLSKFLQRGHIIDHNEDQTAADDVTGLDEEDVL